MKTAYIFPGQGSQKIGMLDNFLDSSLTNELLNQASSALDFDLLELYKYGPKEKLDLTYNAQPAILTASFIAYKHFKQNNSDTPSYFAGHSLGEYTALLAAGAFDLATAVKTVKLRGEYMQSAMPSGGAMAAILGLTPENLLKLILEAKQTEELCIANYNCPGQIVVSGHEDAVDRLLTKAKGIKLPVSVALHSPLLAPAQERLAHQLETISIKDIQVPLINNIENKALTKAEDIKNSLIKQITQPVLWQSGIEYMIKNGVEAFYEFGHSKVLCNMLKRTNKEVSCNLINKIN